MWVSASSDTAITSITAHLYAPGSAADAQEVTEVSDFIPDPSTGFPNLWRTTARIIDGNASPEPVRKGRTITYKGKLQHYTSGAWRVYGSQKVKILFRPKGSSTWYDMGNTYTHSDGTFSKGFTASKDGTWAAVLLYPASTHLVSSGREDYVDVT